MRITPRPSGVCCAASSSPAAGILKPGIAVCSGLEQDAMFWREGQGHSYAFCHEICRRLPHDHLADWAIDHILHEVAVKHAPPYRAGELIGGACFADLDVGRAYRHLGFVAAEHMRRGGLQHLATVGHELELAPSTGGLAHAPPDEVGR